MSFSVVRTPLEQVISHRQHAWRLRASVVSQTVGLPSEVFVYHVFPAGNDISEIFECVASLPQLSDIGLATQEEGELTVPYRRSSELTLDCRSPSELLEVWEKIKEDLIDLAKNFEAMEELETTEEEVLP